jgi:hypothetical protein
MSDVANTVNKLPNKQKHGVIALQMISACHPRLIDRDTAEAGSVIATHDAGTQDITT